MSFGSLSWRLPHAPQSPQHARRHQPPLHRKHGEESVDDHELSETDQDTTHCTIDSTRKHDNAATSSCHRMQKRLASFLLTPLPYAAYVAYARQLAIRKLGPRRPTSVTTLPYCGDAFDWCESLSKSYCRKRIDEDISSPERLDMTSRSSTPQFIKNSSAESDHIGILDNKTHIYLLRWLSLDDYAGKGRSKQAQQASNEQKPKKYKGRDFRETLTEIRRQTQNIAASENEVGVQLPNAVNNSALDTLEIATHCYVCNRLQATLKYGSDLIGLGMIDGAVRRKIDDAPKILLHASAYIHPYTYVYGGLTLNGLNSSLWVLNPLMAGWQKVLISGAKPEPRFNHSLLAWKRKLVLYGGDSGPGFPSSVWLFDTETFQWEECNAINASPLPRSGHAAGIWGDEMIIHGGEGAMQERDDTWSFNLVTKEWSKLGEDGDRPAGRQWHTSVCLDGYLYIWGGYGSRESWQDMWRLRISPSACWERVEQKGTIPAARFKHAGVAMDDRRWLIVGGKDGVLSYHNDFQIFHIDTNEWEELIPYRAHAGTGDWWNAAEIVSKVPALHCHSISFDTTLGIGVIVGGCDGDGSAKDSTILLRPFTTAAIVFEEWRRAATPISSPPQTLPRFIGGYSNPFASEIQKFV